MPKVFFVNENAKFEVASGTTLQDVADQHGIELVRGVWPGWTCKNMGFLRGFCGRCSVWIHEDNAKPNPLGGVASLAWGGKVRACKTLVDRDIDVRTRPGWTIPERSTDWAFDPRPSKWKERLVAAKAKAAGGAAGGDDDADEADDAGDKPAKPAKPAKAAAPKPAAAAAAAPAAAAPPAEPAAPVAAPVATPAAPAEPAAETTDKS